MLAMAFPCCLDGGLGRFRRLTEEEEIAQSVRVILTTHRGERPLRPEFGANLNRFAFETMNTTTKNLIRHEVVSSLLEWERRITNVEVDFEHRTEEGKLLVHIKYLLLRDGQNGHVTIPLNGQ